MPGVVAVAATDKGIFYEGAFGTRDLANGPEMTPDTIFRLASMTKAVTSVAAMQLVEQGRLHWMSRSATCFRNRRRPRSGGFRRFRRPAPRPAKRPIALRHLLTHTAGFGYETWDADLIRYVKVTGTPSTTPANSLPCGCRWCSTRATAGNTASISTGSAARSKRSAASRSRSISATYLWSARDGGHRLRDFFGTAIASRQRASAQARRLAGTVAARIRRGANSGAAAAVSIRPGAITWCFCRCCSHQGRFNGAQLLRPETVALMGRNQIGDINAGILKTAMPQRSNDVDFFPGIPCKWGLGYMINTSPDPTAAAPGA